MAKTHLLVAVLDDERPRFSAVRY